MEPLAGLSLLAGGLWFLASRSSLVPLIAAFQSNLGSTPALHQTPPELMEPLAGFEPATLSLRMRCSTN